MAAVELSEAETLAVRDDVHEVLDGLTDDDLASLEWDWKFWRRPSQAPPAEDWDTWVLRAGRGYGKTRTGAEEVRDRVESGRAGRVALVGATAADTRDVMVKGESGLLAVCPPWSRPKYEPSKRCVTWASGAIATLYSADEPERLRGPQHDFAWGDEPVAWRYGKEAWDNLQFGLRLGKRPQTILTGTPKRVTWLQAVEKLPRVAVTVRPTFDNLANLPETYVSLILDTYEGSRLGRQEIHAEYLKDVEGALWTLELLDRHRIPVTFDDEGMLELPTMNRVVVAVDPPATSTGAECGIVVAARGDDRHGYVLDDLSRRGTPSEWGAAVWDAAITWGADAIVYETNQGGDMVLHTLRTTAPEGVVLPIKGVHASRGKKARAEPLTPLYDRGRIHHVGVFAQLEEQQTSWTPDEPVSPDRLDALVWALSELLVPQRTRARLIA